MEILSTGEKIKRARIYKGVTLKELCGEKISISKMSCIENGKIKADEDVLKFIADKLDIDFEYLVQDVYEQISNNLNAIRNKVIPEDEIENVIDYNLEFAKKYNFYQLAFDLTHILFSYYLEKNKIENIQILISKYYEIYQNTCCKDNILVYYNDMATLFDKTCEYNEAINYYKRLRLIIEEDEIGTKKQYIYACFHEAVCYKNINNIEKAYELLKKILKFVDEFTGDKDKGEFYHEFAIINILLHKVEAEKYIELSYEYQKDNKIALANSKERNGKCYFEIGENDKALTEIEEGISIFPKNNKHEYCEFLINCIATLYENQELEKASNIIEEALNLSIDLEEDKLIEKAYYYKGMIYQKQGQYFQAEMYMNLATDLLLRDATKDKKYKRYNEMALLYYNLKEYKESIKYFTLAMNIEKRL